MATLTIRGIIHTVSMDSVLDKLTRSSDPYLKKRLEDYIRPSLYGSGTSFSHTLTDADLSQFAAVYGEQYVQDPWTDLEQYFAIIGKKLSHKGIPTQLKVLYLFGSGKAYKPNLGSLSVAGEAVAGYCLEQFGYTPLVRPLGVMPDAVLWAREAGQFRLALVEAKASTRQNPRRMIEKNLYQFVLDVKTRSTAFGNRYDAFLVCSLFRDGGDVDCECLRIDLGYYHQPGSRPEIPDPLRQRADPNANLHMRLSGIVQAQAQTADTKDEYLAGLLSEEATRTATVAILEEGGNPEQPGAVDSYVLDVAGRMGVGTQWQQGQDLIKDTKQREQELVKQALQRYRKPEVLDEE